MKTDAIAVMDHHGTHLATIATGVPFSDLYYEFGYGKFKHENGIEGFIVKDGFVLKAFNYRLSVQPGWKVLRFSE